MSEWTCEGLIPSHLPQSSWERANESLCEQAIADIGARTDLYAQSKEFSPLVNSVLKHLKTGKFSGFRSDSVAKRPKLSVSTVITNLTLSQHHLNLREVRLTSGRSLALNKEL